MRQVLSSFRTASFFCYEKYQRNLTQFLPHSRHISPVCLPDTYRNYEGQLCYSSGWGKDAFGSHGDYQSILKEVELPVVSFYRCEEALRRTELGRRFTLQRGMLCAGGKEDQDTCQVICLSSLSNITFSYWNLWLEFHGVLRSCPYYNFDSYFLRVTVAAL